MSTPVFAGPGKADKLVQPQNGVARAPLAPVLADFQAMFSFGSDEFRPGGPIKLVYHDFSPRPARIAMQMVPGDIVAFRNFARGHAGADLRVTLCGVQVGVVVAPEAGFSRFDSGYIVLVAAGPGARVVDFMRRGCDG